MQRRKMHSMSLPLFLALSIPAAAGTVAFKPAVTYAVGTAPAAVAFADFNGDGNTDLAVANSGNAAVGDDGNVCILLGNGDGTFQSPNSLSAGKNPSSIVVGDFNRDARSDVVVANKNGANVSVLLGNGDGTFQNHVEYAARGLPISILAADFNGDSKSDLVVAAQCSGCSAGISVLLGNGDGTFQARIDLDTASPQAIAVADFDFDGHPDLAVAIPFTSIAIFRGNGDGTFQFSTSLFAYSLPHDVQTGDFNSDSKPDLAVVGNDFRFCLPHPCPPNPNPGIRVILNNGDGTFSELDVANADKLTLGDFDGDRNLDLAMSLSTSTTFDVLLGKDDGTFDAPISFTGMLGTLAISADLNRDKAPDLVGLSTAPNTIAVFLNAGTDFSISASNPTPGTISRGQSSSSNVSVTLLNGFDNPIALTCSVQPAGPGAPGCSVSPDSVTPAPNGSATATLTINTGTASAAGTGSMMIGWFLVPIIGLVGLGATSTSKRTNENLTACILAGGLILGGLLFSVACGDGSPPLTSYTVTVTGTSIINEHSSTVSLAIKQ